MRTIFQYLFEQTKQGRLMIPVEEIKSLVESQGESEGDFEKLIKNIQDCAFFHMTIRTFGEYPPLKYLSLKLQNISLECIVWILRSISLDSMKPTDQLIQSRLKECFAIQIKSKWKSFIESLLQSDKTQKSLNKYKNYFGNLVVYKEEDQEQVVFELEGLSTKYEDSEPVDENNDCYKLFIDFMLHFFKEGVEEDQNQQEKFNKWISSVENTCQKSSVNLNENRYKNALHHQEIKKAIPGGKYGCALMLKNCGPAVLKDLSIGKIVSFVSHALKQEVLSHIKTFIVLNQKENKTLSTELDESIKEI